MKRFLNKMALAVGRLVIVGALALTFVIGMFGVIYLQLKGEEIKVPKVVGKNYNVGVDELALSGLRVKKIATRYSEEKPNTILEQRPRAGTTAKTGLTVSVVVSDSNRDGSEVPMDIKDDEEVIEEIEELPELKTEKPKKRSKKKPKTKTRDVIAGNPEVSGTEDFENISPSKSNSGNIKKPDDDKLLIDKKTETDKKSAKPNNGRIIVSPKSPKAKPKTNGDIRERKVSKGNPVSNGDN